MSEKTAVLDTFNIVFREFINDIAEVFPENTQIQMSKKTPGW
jgi:hypothetical protein